MTVDTLLALALFCAATLFTPGPNNLMLMASGANFGFRRTIPHMLGVALGFVFMVLLVGAAMSTGTAGSMAGPAFGLGLLWSAVAIVGNLWFVVLWTRAMPEEGVTPELAERPLWLLLAAAAGAALAARPACASCPACARSPGP